MLVCQRLTQPQLQAGALGHHRLHLRIKKADGVATCRLGLVHGQIGPFQGLFDVFRLAAKQCDTDAGCAVVHIVGQLVILVEGSQNFFGYRFGLRHSLHRVLAQVFQHHHKFVTPQSGHGVTFAHAGGQPLCHQLQQLVALIMAVGVVEGFEVVQVNEQQGTQTLSA